MSLQTDLESIDQKLKNIVSDINNKFEENGVETANTLLEIVEKINGSYGFGIEKWITEVLSMGRDECPSPFVNTKASYIPMIDTRNITNFSNMFSNCSNLTTIPPLDTSNGTNFGSMFWNNKNLTTIPQLDTSNGTNFNNMFSSCSSLTTIPPLDTSNGTNFGSMFASCSKLKIVPPLNTSNATFVGTMFASCSSLTTIPPLDTSKSTSFGNMFGGCSSLTTIPSLDTSKGTEFRYMFQNCFNLTHIPSLDISNGSNLNQMFYDCSSLISIDMLKFPNMDNVYTTNMFYNNCSLENIRFSANSIRVSISFAQSEKLTDESIDSIINGLATVSLYSNSKIVFPTVIVTNKLTSQQKDKILNKNWKVG